MRVTVKIGRQPFLFDDPVYETLLDLRQTRNILIQVEDESGNIIQATSLHDPEAPLEEVPPLDGSDE